MAVAVYQDNVPWGNRGMPNNLVRRRCAIRYKEQMIRIKNTGSIALAL